MADRLGLVVLIDAPKAPAYTAAPGKDAEAVAAHRTRVPARWFAGCADADAARAE